MEPLTLALDVARLAALVRPQPGAVRDHVLGAVKVGAGYYRPERARIEGARLVATLVPSPTIPRMVDAGEVRGELGPWWEEDAAPVGMLDVEPASDAVDVRSAVTFTVPMHVPSLLALLPVSEPSQVTMPVRGERARIARTVGEASAGAVRWRALCVDRHKRAALARARKVAAGWDWLEVMRWVEPMRVREAIASLAPRTKSTHRNLARAMGEPMGALTLALDHLIVSGVVRKTGRIGGQGTRYKLV